MDSKRGEELGKELAGNRDENLIRNEIVTRRKHHRDSYGLRLVIKIKR